MSNSYTAPPQKSTDAAPPAPLTQRTSSFGALLKRPKSSDLLSGSQNPYRQDSFEREREREDLRRQAALSNPPQLPVVSPQPTIPTFGGENLQSTTPQGTRGMGKSTTNPSAISKTPSTPTADPYAHTESMTHRSRYSYATSTLGSMTSPRKVRRRKDPTPYNVLIIGSRNSGKTSFLHFLKSSLALPEDKEPVRPTESETPPPSAKVSRGFTQHYQEIEIDDERIGLTIWDSPGLDKGVVDLQLREVNRFVESKFDDTFIEEMKVVRSPGARDTHIHCVFLILDPVRLDSNLQAGSQALEQIANGPSTQANRSSRVTGALDEDFDLQVLRTLQGKTTVVPVISKADSVTSAHMAYLKKAVLAGFRKAGLDPLAALNVRTEQSESDDSDGSDESEEYDSDGDVETGHGDDVASSVRDLAGPIGPGESVKSTENSEVVPAATQHLPGEFPESTAVDTNGSRSAKHQRKSSTMSISSQLMDNGHVPLSILSPDRYSLEPGNGPVGRRFPWGFADPFNPEHCDFAKLKDAVFRKWRVELREVSRAVFYERWRTNRLNKTAIEVAKPPSRPTETRLMENRPVDVRKPSGGIPISLDKVTRGR